ncbi:tetratricopeptide repeat protein [Nannocystis punicea]|uniref:Tetratricopeptide repeat protein n=1 Tax=Nannocystis punicea TaxID=2995304 RepID=A0ABY7HEF6_9BACT|nr:tetratricopeptide repeat protein [Nannocystis poenicansa]WAS97460.1 tetratricopeptide repeat protein [Nannocystis poenicansa]
MSQEHPHTAIALHAVGQELRRQGKFEEALDHYNRALVLQRTVLGAKHPYTASTLSAIGQILFTQGQHDAALAHHRQAFSIKHELLGASHIFTANTLFDLGLALFAAGQREEALAAYTRALTVQLRALGPGHARTISTQQAIGELLLAEGHFADSLSHLHAALTGLEQMRSAADAADIDRRLIPVIVGVGQVLFQQNQYAEALVHYQRALTLAETHRGAHHEDTLAILHDLGRARGRAGDPDGALEAFRRNLAGLRALYGDNNARVATTLNAIGQVHYGRGAHRDALDHYRQALDIRVRVLGSEHWQTVSSRFNCGTALRELGDPVGAAEMAAAAEALERLLGADHPHVQSTRSWLR